MRRLTTMGFLLAAIAAAPSVARPDKPAPQVAPLPASSLYHEWRANWSGLLPGDAARYGLDPETGEWGYVPGLDPLAVLGAESEPLVIQHANGTIEVIGPPLVEYLSATRGPDGRWIFGCASHRDAAPLVTPSSGAPDR